MAVCSSKKREGAKATHLLTKKDFLRRMRESKTVNRARVKMTAVTLMGQRPLTMLKKKKRNSLTSRGGG
mgnify:CR=1 FL=1